MALYHQLMALYHRSVRLPPLSALIGAGLLVTVVASCAGPASTGQVLRGPTMGTHYLVRASCRDESLHVEVDRLLADIEGQMSTYREDSLLSRFNQFPANQWFAATPELLAVLEPAQRLSELSDGAFDVTVGPLVNLWGFGPDGAPDEFPQADEIDAARQQVGHHYLELRPPTELRKTRQVYVDLSAIAKGYAVDEIAALLEGRECNDYLVEIGGEVRVRGRKLDGTTWRIGVETPDPAVAGGILRVIETDAIAMATSGDYRNFYEHDGRRVAHTIDPRTGHPVEHALASVTVLHSATLWADGFATLLNVLGPDAGFELAERHHIAALFIVRADDGFIQRTTSAFEPYLRQ